LTCFEGDRVKEIVCSLSLPNALAFSGIHQMSRPGTSPGFVTVDQEIVLLASASGLNFRGGRRLFYK
jgi:hypothetical protein